MAFSRSIPGSPVAQINITPLIDVMLVLLIIFNVAAPMVARPLAASLPQPVDTREDRKPTTLEVGITGEGSYRLGERALDDAALWLRIEAAVASDPRSLLVVRAQPDADYQRLATLLSEAQRRGIDNISVAQP